MRVLLDCRMADWSGVGRYTRGLTRALADQPGIEIVQLLAPGAQPVAPSAERLTAAGHPFSVRGALEFGRAVTASGCDIVHCLHFPVPLPVRRPCVVTMHDVSPLVVDGLMPSAIKRALYRVQVKRAVGVADAIIAPSHHTVEDLRTVLGVAPSRVRVAPAAADELLAVQAGPLPGWLEGRRYVLSMGNTRPHKDLPTLLRAFAALPDDELLLVLVGADPGEFAAGILGDTPASARVRFTGSVDDATLRALYAGAALFAFPSLYEGFGMPPLEAMSLGTPVVVAGAASLPEVVGDAGIIVPPGDVPGFTAAIRRVLDDRALAGELKRQGVARAALFSWRQTALHVLAAYEEVEHGRAR